ncbi:hypothetical protein BKA56DRAFT_67626 [Ilyonectria sp. MPI-CAGE-AT-0026]|nr:hypothetical protein BKA56DRAFT_67626 [Ilyonectria sp. MPI-CAGE-AT-0026]
MQSGVQGRLADWTPFWGSLVMRFRFQRDAEIRMSGGRYGRYGADVGSRHGGCGAGMAGASISEVWPASATSGTDLRLLPQTWGKRQAHPSACETALGFLPRRRTRRTRRTHVVEKVADRRRLLLFEPTIPPSRHPQPHLPSPSLSLSCSPASRFRFSPPLPISQWSIAINSLRLLRTQAPLQAAHSRPSHRLIPPTLAHHTRPHARVSQSPSHATRRVTPLNVS